MREDAVYARLVFLFLGAPGVILAVLLTLAVAGAGQDRRRRDQALLRLRGATVDTVLRLAAVEAAVAGTGGAALGIILRVLGGYFILGVALLRSEAVTLVGTVTGAGVALSLAAILIPAWRDARSSTVVLIARVLVKLLTGVFDPPPEALSLPWGDLAALVVTATAAPLVAATSEAMRSRTHVSKGDLPRHRSSNGRSVGQLRHPTVLSGGSTNSSTPSR